MLTGDEHMGNKLSRQALGQGISFSNIQDNRFKTNRLSVNMILPLTSDTVSSNALLPFVLRKGSSDYPDFTKLNERLNELYGAIIEADVYKIGEAQVLSLAVQFIDDRYALEGEPVAAECAKLLCGMLLSPPLENGHFRQSELELERKNLVDLIDSELNEKRIYAINRMEALMCEGENYALGRYGDRDGAAQVDADSLMAAYNRAVHDAQIEIMLLGPGDAGAVMPVFKQAFAGVERGEEVSIPTEVMGTVVTPRQFVERLDVSQAKLVMGFRTDVVAPSGAWLAMSLMNTLYGGSPHSKLFANVREKLSLCYYCASRYDKQKGILIVDSGIEEKNFETTKEEIMQQLHEVRAGNFTDEELAAAKLSLHNRYLSFADSLRQLEMYYLGQIRVGADASPEDEAAHIEAINREQVVEAAQRISLDTIYLLTGKEEA